MRQKYRCGRLRARPSYRQGRGRGKRLLVFGNRPQRLNIRACERLELAEATGFDSLDSGLGSQYLALGIGQGCEYRHQLQFRFAHGKNGSLASIVRFAKVIYKLLEIAVSLADYLEVGSRLAKTYSGKFEFEGLVYHIATVQQFEGIRSQFIRLTPCGIYTGPVKALPYRYTPAVVAAFVGKFIVEVYIGPRKAVVDLAL